MVSRKRLQDIRTLAVDSSSRTSVALARVILERKYGVAADSVAHPPDLEPMLAIADAALIIGDPALHIDPASGAGRFVYDLGAEWGEMTGLPMVFAVWAGRKGVASPDVALAFQESCRFGRERIDEIARSEAGVRGLSFELAREYLTRHIVNELGPREHQGMELFLKYARQPAVTPSVAPPITVV